MAMIEYAEVHHRRAVNGHRRYSRVLDCRETGSLVDRCVVRRYRRRGCDSAAIDALSTAATSTAATAGKRNNHAGSQAKMHGRKMLQRKHRDSSPCGYF